MIRPALVAMLLILSLVASACSESNNDKIAKLEAELQSEREAYNAFYQQNMDMAGKFHALEVRNRELEEELRRLKETDEQYFNRGIELLSNLKFNEAREAFEYLIATFPNSQLISATRKKLKELSTTEQTYLNDRDANKFTINGDGTITDSLTGLMWQQQPDIRFWRLVDQGARRVCEELTLGGYSDWRLPAARELLSIVDYTRQEPALNTLYFKEGNSKSSSFSYVSSTMVYPSSNEAWTVDFEAGEMSPSIGGHVRCVRGRNLTSRLVANANGTVSDHTSGLMWTTADANATMTWAKAIEYCSAFDNAGFHDWRLPNIKELASLVNFSAYSPAIDTKIFPETRDWRYWSSTSNLSVESMAYSVNFYKGSIHDFGSKSETCYVRCVRTNMQGDESILLRYPPPTPPPSELHRVHEP